MLFLSLRDLLVCSPEALRGVLAGVLGYSGVGIGLEKKKIGFWKIQHQMEVIFNHGRKLAWPLRIGHPVPMLFWELMMFLRVVQTRIALEVDQRAAKVAGVTEVRAGMTWALILEPVMKKIRDDFAGWNVDRDARFSDVFFRRLNEGGCEKAINHFREEYGRLSLMTVTRLRAVGFSISRLPRAPWFSGENAALSLLPEALVMQLEALFSASCEAAGRALYPEFEQWATWEPADPEKKIALRLRTGFLGICVLLLSLMFLIIACLPDTTWLGQVASLSVFGLLVLWGGRLSLRSWRSYLEMNDECLWVVGRNASFRVPWEEIESIDYDWNGEDLRARIGLVLFRPRSVSAPPVGDPWLCSQDGYRLSCRMIAVTGKSLKGLFRYYHLNQARRGLERLRANGWLKEEQT